jgi:hypothetical protein
MSHVAVGHTCCQFRVLPAAARLPIPSEPASLTARALNKDALSSRASFLCVAFFFRRCSQAFW